MLFRPNDNPWFLNEVRRTIRTYGLFDKGDRVTVALSGGKDSMALLVVLKELTETGWPLSLSALHVDAGFPGSREGFGLMEGFCRSLDVPFEVIETDIYDIVFNTRGEKNPCSLCAKLRRGALKNKVLEQNITTVAFGHTMTDAVNTLFLNLFHKGKFEPMVPSREMDGIRFVRPLWGVEESVTRKLCETRDIPVFKSCCPLLTTERARVDEALAGLKATFPDLYPRCHQAMEDLLKR